MKSYNKKTKQTTSNVILLVAWVLLTGALSH